MCGITGFDGKKSTINNRVFEILLRMNETRGGDSTGIYSTMNGVIKDKISATKFINNYRIKTDNRIIGHTRLATTGAISKRNAHPFQFNSTVGTHNGIINNYLEINRKVNVDSEVIFYLIDKHQNDISLFEQISGEFAIAYVYNDDLYIARHSNPLAIGVYNNTLFYSSEAKHLDYTIGNSEEIPEDILYVVKNNKAVEIGKIKTKQEKIEYIDYRRNYRWGFDNGRWQQKTIKEITIDDIQPIDIDAGDWKRCKEQGKCYKCNKNFNKNIIKGREQKTGKVIVKNKYKYICEGCIDNIWLSEYYTQENISDYY